MEKAEALVQKIRSVWSSTAYGKRQPKVEADDEIAVYVNSATASIESCINSLRKGTSPSAREDMHEIEANLSLLREIATYAQFEQQRHSRV